MIELRHLRTILVISETGNLKTAASRLHLTQSGLSHQVKEIKSRLDLTIMVVAATPEDERDLGVEGGG